MLDATSRTVHKLASVKNIAINGYGWNGEDAGLETEGSK